MKITKIIGLLLFVSILTVSCSKDDLGFELTAADKEIQKQEQTPIDISTVDLIIENAQIKTAPLTPNEAISMSVPSSKSLAWENGFSIELSSKDDFAGVYVQLENTDGTKTNEYYDIPSSTTRDWKKRSIANKKKTVFLKSLVENEEDLNFRVDFGEKIQPGTFCYTICIYDNQGNISAPQQVCVTVKAFGGVSALVGNWSFLKAEQDSIIIFPNEKTCQTRKIECKGEIYDLLNCSFIPEKFELKINADGTYSYVEKYIEKEYTLEFMGSDCVKNTETFDHEFDIYEQTGKWAYDVDSQELVLIEYSSRELDTMEEELHSHTHEGGRLGIPNNRTIISGSSLTITIEDEALEGRKLFFSK